MQPGRDPATPATPGRARWASAAAFAAIAALVVCWPDWPGQLSYDGLHAYEASIVGIRNMVWPPTHAYLFWISRELGAGVGGLFAAQAFALFFGAALSLAMLTRSRAGYGVALAVFVGLFALVTPMLGVIEVHWRDVIVASFACLSLAAWLAAARRSSSGLLALSALALGAAASLRYNAFPLFALWAPLMVWRPFLRPAAAPRLRALAAVALAASLGLAFASTVWRLPDLARPPAPKTVTNIHLFDLLGVSACEGESFVPLAITRGQPLSGEQVRRLYDPRHVQLSYGPHPGIPQLYAVQKNRTPAGDQAVDAAWRQVIPSHLRCYLAHRNAVFRQQIGAAAPQVFYPTHGGIDANPWGFRLARPAAAEALRGFVWEGSFAWWRRPVWLFLAAALVTGALAVGRDARTPLALALLGGACANPALLYLIGPEADARYIFPSEVLCALLIALGAAALTDSRAGTGRPGLAPAPENV